MWDVFVGKCMSVCKVDERHRIVVDKRVRKRINIKAGDLVILEPIDDRSFKVTVINLAKENVEDDPAWRAIHTPVKAVRHIPPEKLEEIMEEEVWRE